MVVQSFLLSVLYDRSCISQRQDALLISRRAFSHFNERLFSPSRNALFKSRRAVIHSIHTYFKPYYLYFFVTLQAQRTSDEDTRYTKDICYLATGGSDNEGARRPTSESHLLARTSGISRSNALCSYSRTMAENGRYRT